MANVARYPRNQTSFFTDGLKKEAVFTASFLFFPITQGLI